MNPYDKSYLNEIVETQGKLFAYVSDLSADSDMTDFINCYMKSRTRSLIDKADAYLSNLHYKDLYEYFCNHDKFQLKKGENISGFIPDWMGEFYAYFQWAYNQKSSQIIEKLPVDFMKAAYYGLHDYDLQLAVDKVAKHI